MVNIKLSGFTLAKGKELKGDDAFELKQIGDHRYCLSWKILKKKNRFLIIVFRLLRKKLSKFIKQNL